MIIKDFKSLYNELEYLKQKGNKDFNNNNNSSNSNNNNSNSKDNSLNRRSITYYSLAIELFNNNYFKLIDSNNINNNNSSNNSNNKKRKHSDSSSNNNENNNIINEIKKLISIIYSNLSLIYINGCFIDKALESIEKSIEYDSENAKAHYRKALCLRYMCRFNESLESLNNSLETPTCKKDESFKRLINNEKKEITSKLARLVVEENSFKEKLKRDKEELDLFPLISIEWQEGKGRCVMANENIEKGTLVLRVSPYTASIEDIYLHKYCGSCFNKIVNKDHRKLYKCKDCNKFLFCQECSTDPIAIQYHQEECPIYQYFSKYHPNSKETRDLRLMSRVLLNALKEKKFKSNNVNNSVNNNNVTTTTTKTTTATTTIDYNNNNSNNNSNNNNSNSNKNDNNTKNNRKSSNSSKSSKSKVNLLNYSKSLIPEKWKREPFLFGTYDDVINLSCSNDGKIDKELKEKFSMGVTALMNLFEDIYGEEFLGGLFTRDEIYEIYTIFLSNGHTMSNVFGKGYGHGFYPLGCYFNHSCVPNVTWYVDDNGMLAFRATRTIAKGEELFLTYYDMFSTLNDRRPHLLEQYRFFCQCPQCEFQSKLTGLACSQCKEPLEEKHLHFELPIDKEDNGFRFTCSNNHKTFYPAEKEEESQNAIINGDLRTYELINLLLRTNNFIKECKDYIGDSLIPVSFITPELVSQLLNRNPKSSIYRTIIFKYLKENIPQHQIYIEVLDKLQNAIKDNPLNLTLEEFSPTTICDLNLKLFRLIRKENPKDERLEKIKDKIKSILKIINDYPNTLSSKIIDDQLKY